MKPKKSMRVSIGRVLPRRPMRYAPEDVVRCWPHDRRDGWRRWRLASDLCVGDILEGLGIITAVEHRP